MKLFNKILSLVLISTLLCSCSNNIETKTPSLNMDKDIQLIFENNNYIQLNDLRISENENITEVDEGIINAIFDYFFSRDSIQNPIESYDDNEFSKERIMKIRKFNETFLIFNTDLYLNNLDYIKEMFEKTLKEYSEIEKTNVYLISHLLSLTNSQYSDLNIEVKMLDNYNKIINYINEYLFNFSNEALIKYRDIFLSLVIYNPMKDVDKYFNIITGYENLVHDQRYSLSSNYEFYFKDAVGIPILRNEKDLRKFPGFKDYYEIKGRWIRDSNDILVIENFKVGLDSYLNYYGAKDIYYKKSRNTGLRNLYVEDVYRRDEKLYKIELIDNTLYYDDEYNYIRQR